MECIQRQGGRIVQSNNQGNGDYYRCLEDRSFTVFVDNLSSSMSKIWLWQIFKFEGSIVNIYIYLER